MELWCNQECPKPREDGDEDRYVCTLECDHEGPHVAEDIYGQICAAWNHRDCLMRPASDPPGLVNLVKELADSLEVMLRHRHGQAHNGDVVMAGKYETCRLCEPARVLIEEARAYPLPASPQAKETP